MRVPENQHTPAGEDGCTGVKSCIYHSGDGDDDAVWETLRDVRPAGKQMTTLACLPIIEESNQLEKPLVVSKE